MTECTGTEIPDQAALVTALDLEPCRIAEVSEFFCGVGLATEKEG